MFRFGVGCVAVMTCTLLLGGCWCRRNRSPLPAAEEVAHLCEPFDVAADDTHVYVACETSIERVSLRGGPPERIVEDRERPLRMAVQGDRVYWTTKTNGQRLKSVTKSGGSAEQLSLPSSRPGAPILADGSGLVLMSVNPANGEEAGLVHYRPSTKTARFLAKVDGVGASATSDAHVYWASPHGNEIWRVSKEGGPVSVLAKSTTEIRSITTRVDAVYFCALPVVETGGGFAGGLMRVPLAGGSPEQLYMGCTGSGLVVNEGWACWLTESTYTSKWSASFDGEVDCVPNRRLEPGGRDTRVFEGASVRGLLVRSDTLYWIGRKKDAPNGAILERAPLTPPSP